ncbi:MAG: HIRAN domain-containing protein [Myxococcota bacterium]|nr:HIRAN domain-containing protein [Myxococcota bacterium]
MDDIINNSEGEENEIYTKIVGVSFQNPNGSNRQEALHTLMGESLPLSLTLRAEPENPHDPYAVAILSPKGVQLGYIRQSLSYSVSKMMEYGYQIQVDLITLTGTEDASHHYGANIRIRFEEPSFTLDF